MFEGLGQLPDSLMVYLLQTHLQDVLQDVKLLGCLVDPDGAASDLAAVQHQVVVLAPDLNTPEVFSAT